MHFNKDFFRIPALVLIILASASCNLTEKDSDKGDKKQTQSGELKYGRGLMGYISADAPQPDEGYGAGMGFYVAVYPILPEPIDHFQIGLASTWIVPDNSDNKTVPLCPEGTHARDNWDERKPTYGSVFQTIEGGLGMWGSTQFRAGYKPPKFQIVGVPDCYSGNYLISPGWSNKTTASADDKMGIAQLSNRFIVPPDGFTFQGNPNGELFGYSWMTLPLMDPKDGPPPTGDQHWTLFLSLENFKGPVAFVIPETWSKLSKDYAFIQGRCLDTREGKSHGGAQEFNTVPYYEAKDKDGTVYSKVPNFIYPVDENGRTVLMQDIRYYSSAAIADDMLEWRKGGAECSGSFNISDGASFMAKVEARPISFRQTDDRDELTGIDNVVETTTFDEYSFGLQWKNSSLSPNGDFPQYYKDVGDKRVVVAESEVPRDMRSYKFDPAINKKNYSSPKTGAWGNPGPAAGPFYTKLADGSTVTYYWYRFIDQPSMQQYKDVWGKAKCEELQSFIEKMHKNFTIEKEYMPPPRDGKPLVSIDDGMIVDPPEGFEIGYVPIVTSQEIVE